MPVVPTVKDHSTLKWGQLSTCRIAVNCEQNNHQTFFPRLRHRQTKTGRQTGIKLGIISGTERHTIDDLRKSRGMHSVSAHGHGLSTQVHAYRCSAE